MEEVSDQELHRIATRIRSIRRREMLAKALGAGVAFVVGVVLYFGTFAVSEEMLARTRVLIASFGLLLGVAVYRKLMPREDPADVGRRH